MGSSVGFCMISRPYLRKNRTNLSHVGFPGKQTQRWSFAHGTFTGERSPGWGEGPGGKGGSSIGQREELGCDTVTTEVSADPVGRAEAGAARVIPS